MKTRPLRFWPQRNDYIQQAIIIPGEYVESIVLRAVGHEAGHIIAAHHHRARVVGICIGFIPERNRQGMFIQALYESKDWSVETCCVVKAAGPAADLLYQGGFSDESASGDLRDIERLTGRASLEPYLSMAKEILVRYPTQFRCIIAALSKAIETAEDCVLEVLPDNNVGAFLLDGEQLMKCLDDTGG
jgi:hypothetical protein